ncbi:MAG: DUF4135 domain-containing protein [Verrucomicrobia bacterium]|nr:DUF4135 domain-containing protein [Verrucomicrobiota bacterium]
MAGPPLSSKIVRSEAVASNFALAPSSSAINQPASRNILIEKALAISRAQRNTKLQQLTQEQKKIVEFLQIELEKIEEKFQELKRKIEAGNASSTAEVKSLNEEILTLSRTLPDKVMAKMNISRSDLPFQDPNLEPPFNFTFEVYSESWLNAIVNRTFYINEINLNVQNNRDFLFEKFNIPLEAPVGNFFPEGETHNGGKKTVLIGFKTANGIKKLVYKPRDARVDKAIVELFVRLNGLDEKERSSKLPLPEYKITNWKNNQASIWEFIPGPNLGRKGKIPQKASSFVESQNNDELKIKLVRLDDILKLLHVSDLHGENVIMKKEGEKYLDIVPIDLENVFIKPNRDIPTKLGGQEIRIELERNGLYKGLTQAEKKLTEELKQEMSKFSVRYLPLGTTDFGKLTGDLNNIDLLYNNLERACSADGIELDKGQIEIIKGAFILDILNNDIPFFTEKEGNLYYGLPEKNMVIGRRRV